MRTYDRASWHFTGDFPDGLPPERGATHIGCFLAWCTDRGLIAHGDSHAREAAKLAVRLGTGTPSSFALEHFDGAVTGAMLSASALGFAEAYYDAADTPSYLDDYVDEFWDDGETIYHVPDTWESYARISPVLSERYEAWLGRSH